jgi:hypothetical protein
MRSDNCYRSGVGALEKISGAFEVKNFFPVELHFFFNPLEKKSAPEHAQYSLPAVFVFQRI